MDHVILETNEDGNLSVVHDGPFREGEGRTLFFDTWDEANEYAEANCREPFYIVPLDN